MIGGRADNGVRAETGHTDSAKCVFLPKTLNL